MALSNIYRQVLVEVHRARGDIGISVRPGRDEVYLQVEIQFQSQLGQEDKAALQRTKEHRKLVAIVIADLCRQLVYPGLKLLGTYENSIVVCDIKGLDMV